MSPYSNIHGIRRIRSNLKHHIAYVQEKFGFLTNKWKSSGNERNNENIRNVKYSDQDLEDVVVGDVDDNIIAYGGVNVSENMKAVLGLPPKLMTYNKIDTVQIETEIQKGLAKARYSLMSEGQDDDDLQDTLNLASKSINYSCSEGDKSLHSNRHSSSNFIWSQENSQGC